MRLDRDFPPVLLEGGSSVSPRDRVPPMGSHVRVTGKYRFPFAPGAGKRWRVFAALRAVRRSAAIGSGRARLATRGLRADDAPMPSSREEIMRGPMAVFAVLVLTWHVGISIAADKPPPPRKTDLNAQSMSEFYGSCIPSCATGQKKGTPQQQNLDFFIDAYCACYCSRLATQVTAKDLADAEKLQKASNRMASLGARSSEVCFRALSSD